MAQRLATEYKNVTLTLTKDQVTEFFRLFRVNNARIEEKVLDSGDYEMSLDDQINQLNFTMTQSTEAYIVNGDCIFKDRALAEIMRKAMATYRGEATVYRIFHNFIVEYCYEFGTVASIRELNACSGDNLIFENMDFSFTLQKIFANKAVEQEIVGLRDHVDHLLDQRNTVKQSDLTYVQRIDHRLDDHSKRLNQLEA